jgi:hypothetical protein
MLGVERVGEHSGWSTGIDDATATGIDLRDVDVVGVRAEAAKPLALVDDAALVKCVARRQAHDGR